MAGRFRGSETQSTRLIVVKSPDALWEKSERRSYLMRIHAGRACLGLVVALWSLISYVHSAEGPAIEEITQGLQVVRGAVNGVLLQRDGKTLAVYGDPRENPDPVDTVLLTHHRRDVVWAGRTLVAAGAKAVVPAAEVAEFSDVRQFWSSFAQQRFHDYTHKSTKVLGEPMPVWKSVRGGETLTWEGLPIRVLDTPGYTPGAVTYLMELDGQRIAFTGDLMYRGREDPGSVQFSGCHPRVRNDGLPWLRCPTQRSHNQSPKDRRGAAVRDCSRPRARCAETAGDDQRSHRENPGALRQLLVHRCSSVLLLRRIASSPRPDACWAPKRRSSGCRSAETTQPLPSWIVPIDNARLIVSSDKTGFLVDCGSQHIIDELKKLQTAGKLTAIEHAFITHYHDDHTDQVAKFVETFGATVHASRRNWDILENPAAYRLPCLTTNPHSRLRPGRGWVLTGDGKSSR